MEDSDTTLQDAVEHFDMALDAALARYLDEYPTTPELTREARALAAIKLVAQDTLGWRTWAHAVLNSPYAAHNQEFRRSLAEHLSQEAARLESGTPPLSPAARH